MQAVRLNDVRIRRVAGERLVPGLNHVKPGSWQKMQEMPACRRLMERGVIVPQGSEAKEPNAKELVEGMSQINDPDRLRKLAQDGRKQVAQAAQRRLEEITG